MDTPQERFALTPRRFDPDRDWFGLEANPSRTINVPLVDPYLVEPDPAAPWYDTEQDSPEAEAAALNHTLRKVHIMAGETTITVIGNLTSDPELRFTPVSRGFGKTEGTPVANFTVASTPRTFDPASNEWKDGETLFLRATVWRDMAENVAASLSKGSRVVVSGRLKPRTYETKAGEKRTVVELEADEVALSLRYTAAAPARVQGARQVAPTSSSQSGHHADETVTEPGGYADDDPWFGKNAKPTGH
jgi:single-strand DNA-binding protein